MRVLRIETVSDVRGVAALPVKFHPQGVRLEPTNPLLRNGRLCTIKCR